jgi:hypothetical protein
MAAEKMCLIRASCVFLLAGALSCSRYGGVDNFYTKKYNGCWGRGTEIYMNVIRGAMKF